MIESSNQFANSSLGLIGNLNAFHRFGLWETRGVLVMHRMCKTLLVTYTASYYNYSGNLYCRFGKYRAVDWRIQRDAYGFSQQPGTINHSEGFSTSLGVRRIDFNANYIKSRGQACIDQHRNTTDH